MMNLFEHLPDDEYFSILQSIVAYHVVKYHKGMLRITRKEWESVVSPIIGNSLNIAFEDDTITVTITGNKGAAQA